MKNLFLPWTGLFLVFCVVCNSRADTVAFFYALDKDLETFKASAQPLDQPLKVGSRTIPVFRLNAHRVYCVKMGAGAVETATSAQALLARIPCDEAFSVGPVGMLSDTVKTGCWYRVGQVICYQKGSWTKAGFQSAPAIKLEGTNNGTNQAMGPELFKNLATITVASGEMFIASDNYRQQLHELTGADAVDMNLFGLLAVCTDQRVPLVCWRIVSDHADDHASEDFQQFVSTYDGAGGTAIANVIQNLPANPNSPNAYPNINRILSGQ
jgi:adenosylhomocysteine nucleosidase